MAKKDDEIFERMVLALAYYIESLGGTAAVIGGVSVGKKPGSLKHNYFIQIGVTGKMPGKHKSAK